MVFVIQNTQNRDTTAMQIKLDELIRVTKRARNVLLDLEELDDKTLQELRLTTRSLHARRSRARARLSGPRRCRSARLARRHAKAERER
jgi:low affinity Fe/Cu permease